MADLEKLYQTYLDKKAIYDIEYQQNTQGQANLATGIWKYPWNNQAVSQQVFMEWLEGSNASLKNKKSAMDNAFDAWRNAKNAADDKAEQDFKKDNPDKFFDLEKVKLAGALTQKTTKYLIWGTVAIVLIIGAIIIYKRKYAA